MRSKVKTTIFPLQAVLFMALCSTLISAQTQSFSATIDASKAGAPNWRQPCCVRRMAPKRVDPTITMGQEPAVSVQQLGLASMPDTISVPPCSVHVYSFAVQ